MKLLLLHGVGGGAAIWGEAEGSGTLGALRAAGHEAEALDFPGYGANAGAPVVDMDAFVVQVLDTGSYASTVARLRRYSPPTA